MDIFLRYEVSSRELDANILIGLVAASRGHRAIVCEWSMMMRGILLRRRKPGFVHMNSLTPKKSTRIFHRIFKFFGYQISSMDQEAGISQLSYENFAHTRYADETLSNADLIFCWGRDDYETLQRVYPKQSEKFVMTGSARADLWRPKFSSVYAKPMQVRVPFVLVISSLGGPLLSSRLHEELISLRKGGLFDRHPEMVSTVVGQYKEGADLMLAYLDLVRYLTLHQPELEIVIKAHPWEDPKIWREILSEIGGRVSVDTKKPTSQLMRESAAVITTGSTTSFEAELAETPLISFQPIVTSHRNAGFAESLGYQAKTAEEVDAVITSILNHGYERGSKPMSKITKERLSQKVYFDDEQLAAERMVSSWEAALDDKPPRPSGGSILSMGREERRYFVASAFPALIRLFVPKKPVVWSFGSKKKRKRPPVDRKLVGARVKEIRSIIGLQESVSFRFKGSRGLVFEPSIAPRH